VTLSLIAPALLLIFGLTFFAIWFSFHRRRFLLHLAAGCVAFAAGAMSQVLYLPRDTGLNALVSGALYTAAVCLVVQGVLERARVRLPWAVLGLYAAVIMSAIWYFFYVDRNLLVRVYVLNAGFGLLFCLAALRVRQSSRQRPIDRVLFFVMLLFGLHFLPRTLLSMGAHAPQGALAFADSRFWQLLQLSLAVFSVALALALLVAIAADAIDEVRKEGDKDWLTGVYNRRGFEARVRSLRSGEDVSVALIVCDVDNFKRINDLYGHQSGDKVLSRVAEVLQEAVRKNDVLGRIGGEEFGIFLPATDAPEALRCAERLRGAVEHAVRGPDDAAPVTISAGVAHTDLSEPWDALYQRADAKLYQAKRAGRNRVVC
jgi:diguanylate cyclase (GGDEF)-like protein